MDIYHEAKEALKVGDINKAGNLFEYMLAREPRNPGVLLGMATVLSSAKKWPLAIPLYDRALSMMPRNQYVLNDLAICFRKLGHEEEAQKLYKEALTFDPKDTITLSNLSGAYINWGSPEEALKYAEKALEADPENHSAAHHKGIALLEMGDYKNGFDWYRKRQKIKEHNPRDYQCPEYDGTEVDTVVIHGEQGIGDEILFMGWMKNIKAKNIIIECTPRLIKTFARSFGVPCYATPEEVLKHHKPDRWVAMGTLPCYGLDRSQNYITPDPERVLWWKNKLGPKAVALSWHGGTMETHSYLRNAPLKFWKRLATMGNCVSIQYGGAGIEAAKLEIPHFEKAIEDLDEMCAIIKACDLVICANSTPVHMAGAMGVPCWTMTPEKPAWRYGLKGEKMPFYESVTQIRANEGWDKAFSKAEANLAHFLGISGR